jgi:hypothetical protein
MRERVSDTEEGHGEPEAEPEDAVKFGEESELSGESKKSTSRTLRTSHVGSTVCSFEMFVS